MQIQRDTIKLLAGAVVSSTLAGTAGYFFAKKRLEAEFDKLIEEEIAKAREYYALVNKKDEFETPEGAVKKLIGEEAVALVDEAVAASAAQVAAKATAMYQGQEVNVYRGNEGVTNKNITAADDKDAEVQVETEEFVGKVTILVEGQPIDPEEFDMEEEREQRRNGVPHIVTFEEYEDVTNFNEQASLTYFEADDTLVDEDSQAIDDVEGLVGRGNLLKFGHGALDTKTVYVRNDARGMDFEITKHSGSYVENVLGLTADDNYLAHSSTPRRRRVMEE